MTPFLRDFFDLQQQLYNLNKQHLSLRRKGDFHKTELKMKKRQRLWARQIGILIYCNILYGQMIIYGILYICILYSGMDRMAWEGFRRQRTIGQLMFESLPQIIVQTIIIQRYFKLRWLKTIDDENNPDGISLDRKIIVQSLVTAILNVCVQFLRIYFESKVVEQNFIDYSLNCITARVSWTPFKHKIDKFREKGLMYKDFKNFKAIQLNYDIKWEIPLIKYCTKMRISVDFDFSETSLRKITNSIELLQLNNKLQNNGIAFRRGRRLNRQRTTLNKYIFNKFQHQYLLEITIKDSCNLIPVHLMVEFMLACRKKCKLVDIAEYDWVNSIQV